MRNEGNMKEKRVIPVLFNNTCSSAVLVNGNNAIVSFSVQVSLMLFGLVEVGKATR